MAEWLKREIQDAKRGMDRMDDATRRLLYALAQHLDDAPNRPRDQHR